MRIIVYTCNVNAYDKRKPVLDIDKDTTYIYYSDDRTPIQGWNVIKADMSIDSDPVKVCRYYKTNSHLLPPHDYSIWIDSSMGLKRTNILEYVKKSLNKADLACYYHDKNEKERNCIYIEGAVLMENGRGNPYKVLDQMIKYRTEGFPEQFDLMSTGVIIRTNNDRVKKFNEAWWNEIKNHSKRDQLSQMYAIWKTKLKYNKILEDNVYNNELVKHEMHTHKELELRNKLKK